MADSQPFKAYFGVDLAARLAGDLRRVYPAFDADSFVGQVAADVESLELKDRVALIAAALRDHLPADYPTALATLLAILGPELDAEQGMFEHGYHVYPLAHFVEVYGLDHYAESMRALHAITRRFSSEFAIRPYLRRYPQRTLAHLREWAHDPNPHVRRLVSEGTRPRLPWAMRLDPFIADPTPTLALLDLLHDDPSAYVRKSVANHLNDISKDHPARVIETLTRWQTTGTPDRIAWIARHALRSLVKAGDPAALALLGYGPPQVVLADFSVSPAVIELGEAIELRATLRSDSDAPQPLVIDYAITFVRARGKTGAKVFKLTTTTLDPGAALDLAKTHVFKPVSVRRYYPGVHCVALQVNGVALGDASFELIDA